MSAVAITETELPEGRPARPNDPKCPKCGRANAWVYYGHGRKVASYICIGYNHFGGGCGHEWDAR